MNRKDELNQIINSLERWTQDNLEEGSDAEMLIDTCIQELDRAREMIAD